ncbi:hypothetical protein HXX76_012832 [Chlamydomonas incerta]|uniref:Uncharacterized protein n=1 Tax=Chlamydomonas incerta TaxID=51695 RepID=A0A835VT21_CHLIN|nr:hypothetical protein HXX76_012832 [Chlamydomonas incerta]|eukprot:KAG2426775.1 hypothetical protein HXX76_012832 [Chlamydomonas incerta]
MCSEYVAVNDSIPQGYLSVSQVVDVPDDLAASPEALATLFPGGVNLTVTGKSIRVPVEITTAVQATAVLTTSLGVSTQVEVGCNSGFLDAFRSELALRANLTTDIISNVSCNAGAAARRHLLRLLDGGGEGGGGESGGSEGGGSEAEAYSDAWDGDQEEDEVSLAVDDGYGGVGVGAGDGAGVDIRRLLAAVASGTCPANGAGSLSLLVLLSVPAAAANDTQQYKTQIGAALDAWTAESASGSGAAGALQLCGPSMDAIVTTTTVRVMSEVPLSSTGASNLSSVCGSADLTATTALGGAGSSVACRVTTASIGGDGRPPTASDPSPAPAPAPVSAAGASTSYLPIIIAAAVTGGVVGAVCLAVIGIVARRRAREKRKREAGEPGDPASSESDHGLQHASSRRRVAAGHAGTETNQLYVGADAAGAAEAAGASGVEAGGILAVILPTAATRGGNGTRPVAGTTGAAAAGAGGGGGDNAFGRRTADMSAAEESELRSAFQHALQSAGPPPRSDDWSLHGRQAGRASSAMGPPAVSAPPGGAAVWSGPSGPMSADRAAMLPWGGRSGPATGSGYISGGATAAGPGVGVATAGGAAAVMRASLDGRPSSPGLSGRSVRVSRRVQPMGSSSQPAPVASRGASSAISDTRISSGGLPAVEPMGLREPHLFREYASTSGAAGAVGVAGAVTAPVAAPFGRRSLHMNPAFEPSWGGAGAAASVDGGAGPMSASVILARATAGGGTGAGGAAGVAGSPAGSDAMSLFERFKSQLTGGLSAGGGRAGSIDGSPGGSPRAGNRGLSLRNITAMFKEGGGASAGASARPSLDGVAAAAAAAGGAGAGAAMVVSGVMGSPFREEVPDIEGAPPLETRGSGGTAVARHQMSETPPRLRGSMAGRSSHLRPTLASPLGPGGGGAIAAAASGAGAGSGAVSVPQAASPGGPVRRFMVSPASGASAGGGAAANSTSSSRVRFAASIPEGSPEHSPSGGAAAADASAGAAVTGLPRLSSSAGPGPGLPAPVLGSPLAAPAAFALGPRPSRQLRKAKTQTASPSLHGDELGNFEEDDPVGGMQQRQQPDAPASGMSAISAVRLRAGAAAGQRSSDNGMLSSALGASAVSVAASALSPGAGASGARRAMFPSGSKSASVLGGRRATHSGVPEGIATAGVRSARPPSLLSPDAAASRAQPPPAAKRPLREAFAPVPDAGPPGSLDG